MTTNHLVLNHTRLTTFRSTESMLGTRNIILLESTTLNNNGIQIHGGLILHFLTIITNGVQGVLMMTTHSIRSSARKLIAIDFNANTSELPLRTPFHNIGTIKYVPLDPRRDPLEPPRGATTTIVQPIVGLSRDH